MPANQTVSFLMKRFAEAGIRVKSRHGQNFLIDLNLLRILVDAAQLDLTTSSWKWARARARLPDRWHPAWRQ